MYVSWLCHGLDLANIEAVCRQESRFKGGFAKDLPHLQG